MPPTCACIAANANTEKREEEKQEEKQARYLRTPVGRITVKLLLVWAFDQGQELLGHLLGGPLPVAVGFISLVAHLRKPLDQPAVPTQRWW